MRCTPPIRTIHTPATTLRSAPLGVLVALVALFSPQARASGECPDDTDPCNQYCVFNQSIATYVCDFTSVLGSVTATVVTDYDADQQIEAWGVANGTDFCCYMDVGDSAAFVLVLGSAFADTISLTSGSGTYDLTDVGATVYAGDGADTCNGSYSTSAWYDEALLGQSGTDTLYGNDGADVLDGGPDADYLYGGNGDDELFGGAADDYIWGDAGVDILRGGTGADRMKGGAGNDSLYGEGGEDLMCGEGDFDLMMGGSESDNMYGGFGVDDPGSDCGTGLNDGAEEPWGGRDYVTTTCAW